MFSQVFRPLIDVAIVLALLVVPCVDSLAAESVAAGPTMKIASTPVTEVSLGSEYSYQVTVSPNEASQERKFALQKAPAGMTISATGLVKWTPRSDDLGDHLVTIRVHVSGHESTQSFFITVTTPWAEKSKVRVLQYNDSAEAKRVFRVGILMINTLPEPIADNPKSPRLEFYTPEKLGHLFFNHLDGSNSFLKEASYGRIALKGTVVGWLHAPKKDASESDFVNNTSYYFGLANDHMDFSKYDVFIVHALCEKGGQQTGWKYPEQSVQTPKGRIDKIGLVWMINSAVFDVAPFEASNWSSGDMVLPTTSWAHEFLHTFGINGHSNSYDCGQNVLAAMWPNNPIKAYGGVFSIMGEHAFGCHPDVLMKSRLGWIDEAQLPTVNKSGTYEIYPLETKDENVKGLFIPVSPEITNGIGGPSFDGFIVEYREPIGFDRYLRRLDGSPFLSRYMPEGKVDRNGVVVYMRYKSKDTDGTVLLDTNPETPFNAKQGIKFPGNVGKFADAILTLNKTFSHHNVSITPVGLSDKGAMRVVVKVGP